MINIIVDASVIIAVIANEPEKAAIISLTEGANILSPLSVHWEIGNAFSAMLKKRRITLKQVQNAIKIYKDIPIRFLDVDIEAALDISAQLNIYAYDAYLIEVAFRHRMPLVTLDKSLAAYAEQKGVNVLEVKI